MTSSKDLLAFVQIGHIDEHILAENFSDIIVKVNRILEHQIIRNLRVDPDKHEIVSQTYTL